MQAILLKEDHPIAYFSKGFSFSNHYKSYLWPRTLSSSACFTKMEAEKRIKVQMLFHRGPNMLTYSLLSYPSLRIFWMLKKLWLKTRILRSCWLPSSRIPRPNNFPFGWQQALFQGPSCHSNPTNLASKFIGRGTWYIVRKTWKLF